jgi:FtsH-binding integral membrane protein
MQKTLHESFFSHMARYVGVGLISGSVVHAGTLGGASSKYITLIILGALLFSVGTLIQHKGEKINKLLSYVLISVIISFGTGMVSGATQHYLDSPAFGAILLSFGLLIAYISFTWQEYRQSFTIKRILFAILIVFGLWFVLRSINPLLIKPIEVNKTDSSVNSSRIPSENTSHSY